jgi:hypothetical protein
MKKINLYVSEDTWQAFRIACLQRKTSPSKEFDQWMDQLLSQWNVKKETSHDSR